ncbi:cytochrome c oxidase subunit 2 [Brevibacillus reuszeri]|uniref:Cytochrome c oxidase subunit 2 n=1 Tax=Brevibacillus reuszeri TaxID=54915 RepID=A0A0K9YMA3_9BACL|nr:cytochrome c oxidase subunit II [Brevibacillus reuszeri]KNB69853.1 cytochrome B [Brevibacillus reuszeri]MED1858207.1 cytochrome c oxidase subunit II [Brevibacillus reuszeri]GED68799.1 cytochrome c oxidase subunit 2 [Brevibacillus reuszeri]
MKGWQQLWRQLSLFGLLALVLTGCGKDELSALKPSGPVAAMQYDLMMLSSAIMIGVFVVVMLIFTYVLIRYRKRPGQQGIPKQVEGNHALEILWTVIPFLLLIIMAIPTVTTGFALGKVYSKEEAVQVTVTAHQFWWEFEYPELGVSTAQDLVLPVGKKVQFNVTSADVMHAFWIPALGGKIDTNPGQENKIWLQADKPGIYYGKCAELCGASHALMDFKVEVMEQADFDKWTAGMKGVQSADPVTATAAGAAQGQEIFNKSCLGCHAIAGKGGKMGPNLTNFADRERVAGILAHTPENIAEWLKDPQKVKPGNNMPNLNLDDAQVKALVDYMSTLSVK